VGSIAAARQGWRASGLLAAKSPRWYPSGVARLTRAGRPPARSRCSSAAIAAPLTLNLEARLGMGRYSDLSCDEYQLLWQCWFSRRAKRSGPAAAFAARKSITVWRVMRRCAAAGGDPSILDYSRFGGRPFAFLLRRNKEKIDRAIRRGETHKSMARRGAFDALRDHKEFRSLPRIDTAAGRRMARGLQG